MNWRLCVLVVHPFKQPKCRLPAQSKSHQFSHIFWKEKKTSIVFKKLYILKQFYTKNSTSFHNNANVPIKSLNRSRNSWTGSDRVFLTKCTNWVNWMSWTLLLWRSNKLATYKTLYWNIQERKLGKSRNNLLCNNILHLKHILYIFFSIFVSSLKRQGLKKGNSDHQRIGDHLSIDNIRIKGNLAFWISNWTKGRNN